ncbi:hydrophobic surface binding protein A domain-containing protein [Trichoderma austrokoningii]
MDLLLVSGLTECLVSYTAPRPTIDLHNTNMKFQLVSLLGLIASTLAQTDANPILTALSTITSDTTSLNTTVATFNGDPLTLIKITVQSAQLLSDINKGTDTANQAANLTLDQTLAIATATLALATDVNQTITTIIDAKPAFDKLLVVDPVILLNLKLEQDATRKFSAAVVAKVPAALQAVAQGLTQGIDDSFAEGIAVYENFL